jgi:CTP:molybdopterin cytidylyltransferase MocA
MSEVTILIPAAGFARRMRGADKLLEPVAGETMLHRQARLALATGAPVLVTLPPDPGARARALDGLAVARVPVRDPGEGMAASIRAGVAAVPDGAAGLMILLADLPDLEANDLTALIAAFLDDPARPILRATSATGAPGHPVIFPADLFGDLAQVTGDAGARSVVAHHRDRLRDIALPGDRAVTDLDTPEAWAAWRARTGR